MVLQVAADFIEDTQHLEERGKLKTSQKQELVKDGKYSWTIEAWERLNRVPEGFMRDKTKVRMEDCARKQKTDMITLKIAEEGIEEGRKMMEEAIRGYSKETDKTSNS